jgi:hypothetical protein
MKNYVRPQWAKGQHSRQAHCDLPEGTYEREIRGSTPRRTARGLRHTC